jgi:hypothetical protein
MKDESLARLCEQTDALGNILSMVLVQFLADAVAAWFPNHVVANSV